MSEDMMIKYWRKVGGGGEEVIQMTKLKPISLNKWWNMHFVIPESYLRDVTCPTIGCLLASSWRTSNGSREENRCSCFWNHKNTCTIAPNLPLTYALTSTCHQTLCLYWVHILKVYTTYLEKTLEIYIHHVVQLLEHLIDRGALRKGGQLRRGRRGKGRGVGRK